MKKSILITLLLFCMVLMLPAGASAAELQYMRIDGKQIGESGDYALPASGHYLNSTWADAATGSWWLYNNEGKFILTLNSAELTTPCVFPGDDATKSAALVAVGDLRIVLTEGTENVIGTAAMSHAMATFGDDISIEGKGRLDLFAKEYGYYYNSGQLKISDAAVNISVSAAGQSVCGISVPTVYLLDATVDVKAHAETENTADHIYGLNMATLRLDNSDLTVAVTGSGTNAIYGLNFSSSRYTLDAGWYPEYYEGDVAPGEKVGGLTDIAPASQRLQTKKFVKIIANPRWAEQEVNQNYRHADFSWVNDTVNNSTEAKPYLIEDAPDLAGLAALVNAYQTGNSTQTTLTSALPDGGSAQATTFAGKYIKLAEDIDVSGKYWTPIGTLRGYTYTDFSYLNRFEGSFNGNGKLVRGLVIDTSLTASYMGLFGNNSGSIDDLTVKVDSITTAIAYGRVGGLVGSNDGGTITNCNVVIEELINGNIYGQNSDIYVGGFAGANENDGTIANCFVTGSGDVTANDGYLGAAYVGGIVGNNDATIKNCYCAGSVPVLSTGPNASRAGAAFGKLTANTAENCYYSTAAAITPENTFGVGGSESAVSGVIGMTDADMKALAFVTTLNTNANAINTANGDTALKSWIAIPNDCPAFGLPRFTYNTPAAITRYGVAATVSYAPVSPQTAGTAVTATVTLTGTATAAGRHTIDLTSAANAGAITPPTTKTKNVTVNQAMTATDKYVFTFTVPAKDIDDLVLTHTFAKLTSIAVNSAGHKTAYKMGEALDVTGLTIKATLADDSDTTVNVTPAMVSGFDSSTVTANQTLTITYQGKTTTYNISIAKAAGPGLPTGLNGVKPSLEGATDGKITGTTDKMEYANTTAFTAAVTCGNTETTGLAAGTYYVRLKATATREAGAYATVTVPPGEAAPPQENPFTDVVKGKYYYDAVLWAVANNITKGTSETTFGPNEACTRGQVVTFLWNAKGRPEPKSLESPFSDVQNPKAYYYKAVLWAVENSITKGMTKTTFEPDATVTRAQFVTFLWSAEGRPEVTVENPFNDVAKGKYYYKAVMWAFSTKVTSGTTAETFSPGEDCTRGQVVSFLYRDLAK